MSEKYEEDREKEELQLWDEMEAEQDAANPGDGYMEEIADQEKPEERRSRKARDMQPETVRRLGLRPSYELNIGV